MLLFINLLKESVRSDFSQRFLNHLRFWYQKKAYIFFMTTGEFHCCWKMYHWKILMKIWLSNGNHVINYIVRYRQLQHTLSLHTSKRFDWFNWNLNSKCLSYEVMMHHLNRKLHSEKSYHAPLRYIQSFLYFCWQITDIPCKGAITILAACEFFLCMAPWHDFNFSPSIFISHMLN